MIPIFMDDEKMKNITNKVKKTIVSQWNFLNSVDSLKNNDDVYYT